MIRIINGDCLQELPKLAQSGSLFHSCVTDPPYELNFMGKSWDRSGVAFSVDTWRAVYDCLLPGAHLVAFGGTRTYHRMACAIEDAGFEIRDTLMWLYGSGFPKSHDVGKGIDKAGATRASEFKEALGRYVEGSGMTRAEISAACGFTMSFDIPYEKDPTGWGVSLPSPEKWLKIATVLNVDPQEFNGLIDRVWRGRCGDAVSNNASMSGQNFERSDKGEPATPEAAQWAGWGTALKPSVEPIVLARKPLIGTVVANVLKHGCGALNIDACRVEGEPVPKFTTTGGRKFEQSHTQEGRRTQQDGMSDTGRWPANLAHDGSPEVLEAFAAFGESEGSSHVRHNTDKRNLAFGMSGPTAGHADSGTAARFFKECQFTEAETRFHFCGKADAKDRAGSRHPTVKPASLMYWLVKLICPPGGKVLDPFAGTGSTLLAADQLGFDATGIEADPTFAGDARRKVAADAGLFAEIV